MPRKNTISGRQEINLLCKQTFSVNPKPSPNHRQYLLALQAMGPAKRLQKAFELSAMAKKLFLTGLRKRFPEKTETAIKELYLQRIAKCYNRNY